ncbi:MAG TPA: Gfo/Idh/MocA family oxidoreductase [Polyangiaceae bacterium]|nr:Gfo/Idh/MocA family oxidoreductase [Polyangiaceae bacterium]
MNEARTVGLAIVGLGPWGRNLLRAFSSVGRARIVAICDVDRIRLVVPTVSAVAQHADIADVLAREDVDAVVLATPPSEHASQALAALAHGKHVFVEKPMALRTRDAVMLEHAAVASRKKLMVGHILRYHPALRCVLELLASGALGNVRRVHAARLGATSLAGHETAWWSLAPHDISAMRAMIGASPNTIRAFEDRSIDGGQRGVRARLTFPRGVSGTLLVNAEATRKTRRLIVVGEHKTAVFDDTEPTEKVRLFRSIDGDEDGDGFSSRTPLQSIHPSNEEPLVAEARHFISAILDGTPILTDAAEGRAVVAALEGGIASLRGGGVSVPVAALEPAPRTTLATGAPLEPSDSSPNGL